MGPSCCLPGRPLRRGASGTAPLTAARRVFLSCVALTRSQQFPARALLRLARCCRACQGRGAKRRRGRLAPQSPSLRGRRPEPGAHIPSEAPGENPPRLPLRGPGRPGCLGVRLSVALLPAWSVCVAPAQVCGCVVHPRPGLPGCAAECGRARPSILPACSESTSPLLSYETPALGFGAHPDLEWPHLNLSTSAQTLFANEAVL